MFAGFDDAIIDRFVTPCARWFERTTGRTHFYLAHLLLGFAFMLAIVLGGIQYWILGEGNLISYCLAAVTLFMLGKSTIDASKEDERVRGKGTGSRSNNPFFSMGFRLMILAMFVLHLLVVVLSFIAPPDDMPNIWFIQKRVVVTLTYMAMVSGFYLVTARRPPYGWGVS